KPGRRFTSREQGVSQLRPLDSRASAPDGSEVMVKAWVVPRVMVAQLGSVATIRSAIRDLCMISPNICCWRWRDYDAYGTDDGVYECPVVRVVSVKNRLQLGFEKPCYLMKINRIA